MKDGLGRALGVLLVAAGSVCRGAELPNAALAYNTLMLDAIRADNTGPTSSTRNLAILHTSIYDTVNSIDRTHQAYFTSAQVPAEVSIEAAASAAGREVMKVLYPSFAGQTEDLHAALMAVVASSAATTNGLKLGRDVASAALSSREADGSSTQVPYVPSTAPGQWVRTPPFYRPPLDPHWRYVRLFCLESAGPYVAPGPPALTSAEYASALNEVKALGALDSAVRTVEQEDIAVFWSDFSYTAMPPGHWHEIAGTICQDRQMDLVESARLMALMSLVQADAAIVCWEGKYRHNFWRPVTAIQRADEDGNPETVAETAWEGLLPAPNFPEYPSGHSTFSKAGAQVLARVLGTDAISITAWSDSLPGVTRHFDSLAACADEVGRSRVYGGFHFEFANRDGKVSGQRVADFVASNYLLPLSSLPLLRLETVTGRGTVLRLHGELGHQYEVQTSSDLRSWSTLTELSGQSGGAVFEDEASGEARSRFYRAHKNAVP